MPIKYFYSNARLRDLLFKAAPAPWAEAILAPEAHPDHLAPNAQPSLLELRSILFAHGSDSDSSDDSRTPPPSPRGASANDVDVEQPIRRHALTEHITPDGFKIVYDGPYGFEYISKRISPDGKFVQTFDGPRGSERLHSAVCHQPDGKTVTANYLGDRGKERLVFVRDGNVKVTCTGPPTKEYGIETELPNGIKYFFEWDGAIDLDRYTLDLRSVNESLLGVDLSIGVNDLFSGLTREQIDDSSDDGTTTIYSHPFDGKDGLRLRVAFKVVPTNGSNILPATIEVMSFNTTVCLGEATPDNPMAINFDGNGTVRVSRPDHTAARHSRTSEEHRRRVAMRGFERNRNKVYQELSRLDSQGNPLDAQAMPMYGSDGAVPEGSSQLCIMGPGGVHKTFDFTGMSHEERTNAAAEAVMAIGTSCAPPGYELSASAQGIEVISRPGDDGGEAPVPQSTKTSPHPNRFHIEVADEAMRCLQSNVIPPRPESRLYMAKHLMEFKEWSNVPSAYSTLVKMANLSAQFLKDRDEYWTFSHTTQSFIKDSAVDPKKIFGDFTTSYLNLFAYMLRQPHCPTVASAFKVVCNGVGLKTKDVERGWDLFGRAQDLNSMISTAFNVVRQLAEKCTHDALSDFDNHPLWRSIYDAQLCFYKKDKEFVLRAPEAMQMEADMAAEALLREEEESKAKAATSSGKAAKRRARQKQKKEKAQLAPLEPIGEDEEVVTPVAEEAPLPVAAEEQGDAPSADAGVFNLSDIGSALTDKQDDAATSVATALMCIVCYSKERSVACVPCGHKCLCEDCGTKETMSTANGCPCPMCREEVMMFMKVFE